MKAVLIAYFDLAERPPRGRREGLTADGIAGKPRVIEFRITLVTRNGHAMLDEKRIQEIAREAANANLASANISSVSSSTAIDSEGHDALRIRIVIKPGSESKIKGDAALDTLLGIQDRLRNEGEERLAIIEYATKKELEAGGNS